MSGATGKICCVCHKDVSTAKRVKDAKGHYYCAACHAATLQRQPAAVAAGGSASENDDLVPLAAPVKAAPRPMPQPVAVSKPKIPEFCPNCGAKVLANRKFCFKCNRDVTQMDKLIALRAQEAKGPSGEQKFAIVFGHVMRVVMWAVIAGVVVILILGMKMMFLPGGLWDNYPKTREAAVREFLQHIAAGTDKSYEKAFMLISFRERSTGKSSEDVVFKSVFKQIHDEFNQKYGNDWIGKIKLENLGSNDKYADDEVDFRLTLGNDTYLVASQVQLDITRATANMTLPRTKKPVYKEDGENHFGILDIAEYPVHPKRHMLDVAGPGQPETLEVPAGGGGF